MPEYHKKTTEYSTPQEQIFAFFYEGEEKPAKFVTKMSSKFIHIAPRIEAENPKKTKINKNKKAKSDLQS